MKILRDYRVTGALYVNDTGVEAQVSDQVTLFLDRDAEPLFPVSIIATIQHPITKVECGSVTSYSLEYNEDNIVAARLLLRSQDIIDATVVSGVLVVATQLAAHEADITAHLASSIPFTPTGGIVATNVQAAIAEVEVTTGTGVAAALALPIGTTGAVQLNGDPLTPTSIILPDVTSIVPPNKGLGLKNGKLSVGDGVTTGGVPAQPRNVKGMFKFDTGTQPITGAFARVISLPIYPADLTYLDGSGYPKYTMYGEITLSNDSYSSAIKDWGIGFAFNDDSLLAKSPAKWIYGSLHPAAGTSKNMPWMAAKLRSKSRLYLTSGNYTFYDPDPAFTPYGVTYATGADAVLSYPTRTMPNQSGTQILNKVTGGLLWLMVHAEKMTGEPVGGVITVSYDLTIEFP